MSMVDLYFDCHYFIVVDENLHFGDEINDADIDRFVSMSYVRPLLGLEASIEKLHEALERQQYGLPRLQFSAQTGLTHTSA